jgi:hypothetical protein
MAYGVPYSFRQMTETANAIRRSLSDGRAPPLGQIKLPNEFAKAWLHYVMFVVLLCSKDARASERHLEKCKELVERGRENLIRSVIKTPLRQKEAVMPLGVLSVIITRLLQDVTKGQPDVMSSYWAYLKQLVSHFQTFSDHRILP